MTIRITGMQSGLDTDSIIADLVAVRQTTVDKEIKEQARTEVLLDTWKELNTEIYDLFTGLIDELRYSDAYSKKATTTSNDSIVSVLTGANAVNSTQTLEVTALAKAGYLTGGKLDGNYTSSTKLSDMGIASGSSVSVTVGDATIQVEVDDSTTIASFVSKLNAAGVSASFDETNQRFFISATDTGAANDFSIVGSNVAGMNMLDTLGLSFYDDSTKEALASIVTNVEANIDARIALAQETLIDEVDGYTDQIEVKLYTLNDKYGDLFEGVDLTDADAVLARIEEIENDPAAAELEADDTQIAELTKFKEEVEEIITKQEEALGKLELTDDGYVLKQDQQDAIRTAAEAEAVEAQSKLDDFDNLLGEGTAAGKIDGADAVIQLNGIEFTSESNSISVNGLTFDVKNVTAAGEQIVITTGDDTSGIYDKICDFFTEYNTLINKMDKLYNADSASDYDPLTDDEKDSMSDSEIEEWEAKIQAGILSGDSTLSSVSSALKSIMSSGISVNGQTMYLSDFGIETLGYFTAKDDEKNAYHIAGADGFSTSTSADVLQSMISSDPDTVEDFFTQLSKNLYDSLFNSMKSTTYSSSYTVYDDKKLATEISDYETSIAELQEKLTAYEEYWYNKFSAMEVALTNLQSNSSAISSLFTTS